MAATDECTGTRPTAESIRALPQPTTGGVDWAALGYPAPEPYTLEEDPLQPVVELAIGYMEFVTCGRPIECTPPEQFAMMMQAIQFRSVQWIAKTSPQVVEQEAAGIASFSAGSYSETTTSQHRSTSDRWINPWPLLNELVWMLLPAECRAKWETIVDPNAPDEPWFEVSSPDWSAFSSPGDFDWDPLFTSDPSLNLNRLDYYGWWFR